MSPEIAAQIQAEQEHGRTKYGRGPDDLAHDDANTEALWHRCMADHLERSRCALPMEWRQSLIKLAGLAVSAVEAFDRRRGPIKVQITEEHAKCFTRMEDEG